jgi:hypothetical protein
MRTHLGRVGAVVAGASVLVILGGVGGAVAGTLVTSAAIKNETIQARDIGPGAVTRSEVRDGSLGVDDLSAFVQGELAEQAQDGAEGPAGPAGQTGPVGPQGPAGADGQDGADGVAALESASSSAIWAIGPAGAFHSSSVACPEGKVALGGGFRPDPQTGSAVKGLQVVSSTPAQIDFTLVDDPETPTDERLVPLEAGGSPNGWMVTGFNNGNTDLTVEPWVLCAAVGS